MIRKIVDSQKLNEDILNLLVEKFPDGYSDKDIIAFRNAQNEYIEDVEVRTEDTVYLVKVGKRLVQAMEKHEEEEDDAMMINGLEHGDAYTYYGDNDQTLKQHALWKEGKLNGLVKVFDEDGNLSLEQSYSNGDETGKFKQYFKDGVISHEGYKEKGELKGIAKVFWETGELQVELNYDSNSMKTYKKDGQLFSEKTFEE